MLIVVEGVLFFLNNTAIGDKMKNVTQRFGRLMEDLCQATDLSTVYRSLKRIQSKKKRGGGEGD